MDIFFDWMAVLLLAALGVMIKYLKMHWLIAGYNTSKAEDRAVMSEKGIGEFMGKGLFVLAAILAWGNIGKYLGYPLAQTVSWVLFIPAIVYIVIGAQKFVPDRKSGGPDRQQKAVWLSLAITAMVIGLVGLLTIGGQRESAVTVEGNAVIISGMYSSRIDMGEITAIRLEESIPQIKSRTNGYAFGSTLKGHFLLEKLGRGRLYLHSRQGPFIYIMRGNEYTIINFRDQDQTRKLYKDLVEKRNKS